MRTVQHYTDYGFGFPVILDEVEIREFLGEEIPIINLNELEDQVVQAIPNRVGRLTGDEVRFVRLHFGMTLTTFGNLLGVSHPAVKQWEMKASSFTGMEWAKEKILRLEIALRSGCHGNEFEQLFRDLENERPIASEPLRVVLDQWTSYPSASDVVMDDFELSPMGKNFCQENAFEEAYYSLNPGSYLNVDTSGATDGDHIAHAA